MTSVDSPAPAGHDDASTDPERVAQGAGDDGGDRPSKWTTPPPRDWRWWIGGAGKALIALGLLMFAFVGYQLWGTAIETARAQRALASDFDAALAAAPPVTAAATTPPATGQAAPPTTTIDDAGTPSPATDAPVEMTPAVPVVDQNIPIIEEGDAIARLEIPRIGLDVIVVAGVAPRDLKRGPGHFPETPLPGQLGNAAIAGHRTTYGQPFHDVDDLEPGDDLIVTTLSGRFTYQVTGQQIVEPSDYEVIATSDPDTAALTLTSCHPKWTAQQRIIISSQLDPTRSAPVGAPLLNYGLDATATDGADTTDDSADAVATDTADPDSSTATTLPSDAAVDGSVDGTVDGTGTAAAPDVAVGAPPFPGSAGDEIADAFGEGWFSDPGAPLHVGLWGTLLATIGLGAWLLSRRFRHDWVGLAIGVVPFVLTLYFFFQNVNRLLPPNL